MSASQAERREFDPPLPLHFSGLSPQTGPHFLSYLTFACSLLLPGYKTQQGEIGSGIQDTSNDTSIYTKPERLRMIAGKAVAAQCHTGRSQLLAVQYTVLLEKLQRSGGGFLIWNDLARAQCRDCHPERIPPSRREESKSLSRVCRGNLGYWADHDVSTSSG